MLQGFLHLWLFYFEKNNKWTGINIEPIKKVFDNLVINRPNNINLNCAVCNNDGETDFLCNTGYTEMISGIKDNFDIRHLERLQSENIQHGSITEVIKVKTKKFNNTTKGFYALIEWLKAKNADNAHACMEATGFYGLKLAQYLYDNNLKVSVVNPARIKGFAQSKLCRVKTDKADSKLIANFCQVMKPDLWHPTAFHVQELQNLLNLLHQSNLANGKSILEFLKSCCSILTDTLFRISSSC